MATILVVDDRPINRQFLTTLLGYAGHRTVEAADGLEALEKAQAEPPDLAIVDIVMPSMDGYAFVRHLRADPAFACTPVIFYTATYLESAARKLAESVGVSYVLTKPADPQVILQTVTEALGLPQGGGAAPVVERPPEDPLRLLTVDLSSKLEDVIPRLTSLIDLGLQISVERDLDRLLQRVCSAARRIVGARFAAVAVLGDDGKTLRRVYTSHGVAEDSVCNVETIPPPGSLIDKIIAGRRPVRVTDFDGYAEAECFPGQAGKAQAFLGVPLASADSLYGVLCLIDKEDAGEFSDEDQQVAMTLGAQAGVRYENAKLYHELQEHTTRLQTEIQARALLEGELQRRHDELADANRRKDEFLAMLAHELRNPLAGISNASAILDQVACPDPRARRPHEVIKRQTGHLARMVDDLLDASRITRGSIELRKECVDLATIMREAETIVRPTMEAHGHEFSVSIPEEWVPLDADPARLEQVLTNLLNNAAKYTEPGGRVSLTAEVVGEGVGATPSPTLSHPHTPTPPHSVILRVRDTGVGIAPDLLPRVFDLFAQGGRSLARSEGGLGIGLAVARGLVEMHGGRIEAHSDGPGQGSEFVVLLPLHPDCRGEAHPTEAAGGGRSEIRTPKSEIPRPLRVLLAEDNLDVAEMLAALIEMWGHEVVVAHSGSAAQDLAPEFSPDAILLDIGLPDIDGYEVAGRLRREMPDPVPLLVAVTGYGQEEDRARSREAGFDRHLTKPVDVHELEQLLGSVTPSGPPGARASSAGP